MGRYEVVSPLGAGGMGDVYRARDVVLGRDVALKVPHKEIQNDPHQRARFKREARAVAALNHPNVITVHEFNESSDGVLYIAFEFIRGETLAERLAHGRLSIASALHFAVQIAQGLTHAHEAGIVHRDLKPRNIMVSGDDRLKILDFGLGKFTSPAVAIAEASTTISALSGDGVLMGTVGYMSPEQVSNEPVGEASDQFVFGAVLYEMLTGQRAFHGDTPVQTLAAIIEEEPPLLKALAPRTPVSLIQVVSRCLAKRPEERYSTTRVLLTDLEAIERSIAETATLTGRWTDHWMKVASFVVVATLAGAGFYGAATSLWNRPARAPSDIVTVAVLPISSPSDDATERAYWNGLTEAVSTRLGALPASVQLHVTPAADVRARQVRTVTDARQELGASHVIRGAVTEVDNQLRTRLELIEASSNRVLRNTEVTVRRDHRDVLPNRLLDAVLGLVEVTLTSMQRTQVAVPMSVTGANDFYLQGLGYMQEDKPENVDAAVTLFEHAIKTDPKYASAYAGLGEAIWKRYLNTHDARWAATARETCERALGIDEQQSAPHRCLGTVANGVGDHEKAVEEFQHALAREPDSELARIGLAGAYDKLGLAKRSEETYLDAIRVRPRYWNGYSRLGAFYYTQRRYAEAERMFRQVVTLNPDSWRGYANLGAMLYAQDRTEDAIAAYQRSLAIRPNYQAASNLGTLYFFDVGDYARASEAFRQAVKLDDDEYEVWGNLGASLSWAGQPGEAKTAYAKAANLAEKRLAVNDRDANVTMSLAEYVAELGQLDRARSLMDKAMSLSPGDAQLMFQAGVLYEHNLNDRQKAFEWLGRALEAGYLWKEVERSPKLAALRRDPRIEQLRQRASASENSRKDK